YAAMPCAVMLRRHPGHEPLPYTALFRSITQARANGTVWNITRAMLPAVLVSGFGQRSCASAAAHRPAVSAKRDAQRAPMAATVRSEEHTSELSHVKIS